LGRPRTAALIGERLLFPRAMTNWVEGHGDLLGDAVADEPSL